MSAAVSLAVAVGERVRHWREAAGLSQRRLAKRVGVTAGHISLIESGDRTPSIAVLWDIAIAVGHKSIKGLVP